MAWTLTDDAGVYLAAAGDFLRARAVSNTVLVTVAETMLAPGNAPYGEPALLGWWDAGHGVEGAFLHTPPHPLLLSAMSDHAAETLAEALASRGRSLPGVNGPERTARVFASTWRDRSGAEVEEHGRHRLHRLATLAAPEPMPPGRPRVALASDRALLIAWYAAFAREVAVPAGNVDAFVDDRLGYGGLTLWEVEGTPVTMAGISRTVAGTARVAPVYTPPEHRRRGYGAAATFAVSRAALDAGARDVLLFTDVDNATTNRLYARLGYRPVEDRLILTFRD